MMRNIILVLAAATGLVACSDSSKQEGNPMIGESIRKDLEVVAGRKVLFGHQSVGANIIAGLKDLVHQAGGPELNFVSIKDTSFPKGPYFADAYVGKNSEPTTKCDAFVRLVGDMSRDRPDVALMKFCFVDIREGTNVDELFAYYQHAIADLKLTSPGVTIVHVTVPLIQSEPGWKQFARKILRRENVVALRLAKMNAYNEKLRQSYAGEPIFDLAAIESTFPDGRRNAFEYEGKELYSLISAYTDDGGHLNVVGRRSAASEFVRVVAAALRHRSQ
jgi:hypothetical protein